MGRKFPTRASRRKRPEQAAQIGTAVPAPARHDGHFPQQDTEMVAARPEFAVGQTWRCAGRTAAEAPLVLINRIDAHPLGTGDIYHVSISGVRIANPAAPDTPIEALPHIPVIRQTFERSDAVYVGTQVPDPAYLTGYAQWKREFDAGNAGSFGVSIAEVLEFIERSIAARR